jgi:hypothetical protein
VATMRRHSTLNSWHDAFLRNSLINAPFDGALSRST